MKSRIETALKMLRYRADTEDRSFWRVVMRQLTDSVFGYDKDVAELIVSLLDNQITMQDMIINVCNMMSMYAKKLDLHKTTKLVIFLEFRGDYTDSCFAAQDHLEGDVLGSVQTQWDALADYVSATVGGTVARNFSGDYYMGNSISICKANWKYLYNYPTTYNFLARLVGAHGLYDRCDNWDARYELAWIVVDIIRNLG